GAPGRMDGVIGPPVEYLAELRGRGLSPTALETLGRCPFQYFAGKVLGLDEAEEPSSAEEISPSVRGTIYHRFLSAFYRRPEVRVPEGGNAFPDKAFSAAEREVFSEYGARALGVHPLLWEITRESLLGNLRAFLEWDLAECASSKLRPLLLEEAMEADFPAPRPRGLEDVRLTGVPDRIDAGGGFWRVVDYKTRWKRGPLASLALKGRALQAPLYLELAAGRPRLAGLKAQGAFLMPVEDSPEGTGRPRSVGYTAAAHEENRAAVLAKVAALVESAARGEFLIRPEEGEGGHCGFCAFSGVCRKNHPMSRIRASAA
ncbi:MAG: PD-(D/E)XK nuclease family protein, partial [Elusimicrobiota bacterium]